MEYKVIKGSELKILYCGKCVLLIQVQMTENKGIYCPYCKTCDLNQPPEYILHCLECKKPLAVTEGKGLYCTECNKIPPPENITHKKI